MLRRRFLGIAAVLGVGGLAAGGVEAAERKTVVFRVKGFTCVTCAVGLETLLRREEGVMLARATYPDGLATIVFHPKVVSEAALLGLIAEMGFSAERETGA